LLASGLLASLENESLLLSEALEPVFALSVPTERLRHRINTAIAEKRLLNPPRPSLTLAGASVPVARRWSQAIADLFALSPQRVFAYAGLAAVVLFAITFALVRFKTAPINSPEVVTNRQPGGPTPTSSPENRAVVAAPVNSVQQKVNPPRFVRAGYPKSGAAETTQQ